MAGLAVSAQWEGGLFGQLRIAWLGVASLPLRSMATERILQGQRFTHDLLAAATHTLRSELQPEADLTHSVAAKRHLAGVLLERAVKALAAQTPSTKDSHGF